MKNIGIYNSLVAQLDKLARHNRQGSFRTKERYYEATKRFCAFLAEEYHLHKLSDVSGKHLMLVDDVMTTGTTMLGALRALEGNAATRFSVFVFAWTPLG